MPDEREYAVIDQERMLELFKHVGVNKCPGPDRICGRTHRLCAEQLSDVFQSLFQKKKIMRRRNWKDTDLARSSQHCSLIK